MVTICSRWCERLRAPRQPNRIGFFLHIPWQPDSDCFVSAAVPRTAGAHDARYDLIGFQTEDGRERLSALLCREELGAKVDQASGTIPFRGSPHRPGLHSDRKSTGHLQAQGATEEAPRASKGAGGGVVLHRDRTARIGVDRVPTIPRACPKRIRRDRAGSSDQHPNSCARSWSLSRSRRPSPQDCGGYQDIRMTLRPENRRGRSTGRERGSSVPIRNVNSRLSHAELSGFSAAAKIGLVTPFAAG